MEKNTASSTGSKGILPANVRVLILLVSFPGFVLLGFLIYSIYKNGIDAGMSWFALVYGFISIVMLRPVIWGRW